MKNKVHIIPHSHWDREWYFTNDDSNQLIVYMANNLVEYLQKNPKIQYTWDGQVSLLDDLDKVSKETANKVRDLISEGRIIFGPLYTQSDMRIPSAETILRNFDIAKTLDAKINTSVVYVPDTFGHNKDMPTIVKHAGYDKMVVWRGFDPKLTDGKMNFEWSSKTTGELIKTTFLQNGYTVYGLGHSEGSDIEYRFKTNPLIMKYAQLSGQSVVAIPEGSDQLPINNDLEKLIDGLNARNEHDFQISTWDKYFADVTFDKASYSGPLEIGSVTRVHKSITSTRNDVKKIYFDLENYLINVAEPTLFALNKNGFDYPKQTITDVWKDLLTSSAHDSLGMCNTDITNFEIKNRLQKAFRKVKNLVDTTLMLYTQALASEKKIKENELAVVFNPSNHNDFLVTLEITHLQKGFKIFNLEDEIDYCLINTEEKDGDLKLVWDEEKGETVVKKPNFFVSKVEFALKAKPYSFVELKISEHNETKSSAVSDRDCSCDEDVNFIKTINLDWQVDNGDHFDYSPLKEKDIASKVEIENVKLTKSISSEKLRISFFEAEITLPQNPLLSEETIKTKAWFIVKNFHDKKEVEVKIENVSSNVKVRILFDQVGKLVLGKQLSEEEFTEVNVPENWVKQYKDMPISIESFINYVYDEEKTISTSSTREVSSFDNKIAFTLFRSISQWGRKDLAWRPGRASGRSEHSEDGLMHGIHTWKFIISNENSISKRVKLIDSILEKPNFQFQSENLAHKTLSRFNIKPILSTYKTNFDFNLPNGLVMQSIFRFGDKYILRVRNTIDKEIVFMDEVVKPFNLNKYYI